MVAAQHPDLVVQHPPELAEDRGPKDVRQPPGYAMSHQKSDIRRGVVEIHPKGETPGTGRDHLPAKIVDVAA